MKDLIEAVSKTEQVVSGTARLAELLMASIAVVNGKAKQLDTFFGVRQAWGKTGSASHKWHHEIYDPSFDTKYQAAIQVLGKELCENRDIEAREAEKIVLDSFDIFFDHAECDKVSPDEQVDQIAIAIQFTKMDVNPSCLGFYDNVPDL